ncbi:MAG: hypothetical protein JWP12_3589 [Bacteroidetes bacterium]|nr:hypothetical protein [Bacteroidota bacterium]
MQDTRIKMKTIAMFIVFVSFFASASIAQKNPASKIDSVSEQLKVYVFLSETCPICQSYTLTLKTLSEKYSSKNVVFLLVFPDYYSGADSVNAFIKKYNLPFFPIVNSAKELAKEFNATITPEVFVQDAKGKILYSGRIDDSFYSLGKRRTVISSNDLDDALQAITGKQKVKNARTQAVGCIISLSE